MVVYNIFYTFADIKSQIMRIEVHGTTKTHVEFLANEIQARIVMVNGNAYIATFPSTFNYTSGGIFIKFLEKMFDMYAAGQTLNHQNLKEINAQLYLSDFEMMVTCVPEVDKGEERKRIGQKIKELRHEINMDAKTLAARIGIDASNLSRIEQGHYSVGFDTLNKIANALGAKVDLVKVIEPKTTDLNNKSEIKKQ